MKNFFLKSGQLRQEVQVPFATVLQPVNVPVWGYLTDVLLDLPKIPLKLLHQIVAWQRKIARLHKCESSTSLFLIKDKWVAECFHQTNRDGSMVADVSWDETKGHMGAENAELLAKYAEESDVHCTIHNHVTAGASQSGRDSDDEKNLPGPHITIGNLNQRKLSFHGRLSTVVGGKHAFIPLRISDIIDIPLPPGGLREETLKELEEAYLTFDSDDKEIPKAWEDRFTLEKKIQYNPPTINPMAPHAGRASGSTGHGTHGIDAHNKLEEYIQTHRNEVSAWPFDFLSTLDLTSKETFRRSLDNSTLITQSAATAVAESIAPGDEMGYHKLYDFLLDRKSGSKIIEISQKDLASK